MENATPVTTFPHFILREDQEGSHYLLSRKSATRSGFASCLVVIIFDVVVANAARVSSWACNLFLNYTMHVVNRAKTM